MKKAKAFLAKVLTVAVMVTSVLPIGALNTNAAPTVKTEDDTRWMYTGENGFIMNKNRWIDLKTGEPYAMFGENLDLGENVMPTWHFQSSLEDGNGHGDLSLADAAATVYASEIDIKSQGVRRVMQFDLTQLNDSELRFGIMLKYVDKDHWVYLGQVGGKNKVDKIPKWMVEWKNGTTGSYCNAGGEYIAADGTEAGTKKTFNPAFAKLHLGAEKWNASNPSAEDGGEADISGHTFAENLRVTLTYESATKIRVRMVELELVENEDGNQEFQEKADTVQESELDFKVFGDIRTSAGNKPIYFGFLGGTLYDECTDINVMNVQKGALAEKNDPNAEDVWTENLTKVNFADCGWMSPKKGNDIEKLIAPQVIGEAVSYASIGDPDNDAKKAPDATIYNNTVTDFKEGTASADLRPYTVGSNKEFYLGIINPAVTAAAPTGECSSFKVGINGDKWVYNKNNAETVITGKTTPEIKAKTDYDLSIAVDKDQNVTAEVVTGKGTNDEQTYTLIEKSDNVNVEGLSGSVSLTAKGEVLRVKDASCHRVSYNKTPLEETYDTIVKANANNEFYTDVWGAFNRSKDDAASPQGPLSKVKDTLEGEHKDKVFSLTPQNAQANPDWAVYDEFFDEGAAAVLQSEFDKINIADNKVATGKDALRRAFDKVITPGAPDAVKWYSTESLTAYTKTWNAVKDYLEKTLDLGEGFAGVTKAAVEAQIAAIEAAPGKLTAKTADSAYLTANLDPALTAALKGIDLEDTEGNAKYYNNWNEFKAAVDEAEALKADGANPTIENVDKKIAALNAAKENLTLKTVTSVTDYQNDIADLTADVLAGEYYKAGFDVYTEALAAANAIKSGDTLKDADKKIQDLRYAIDELKLKTLADDAAGTKAIQDEVNAVKTEIGGKNYVKDSNWTAYEAALAALETLLKNPASTKAEVENALEVLKEAKAKLTVNPGNTGSQDPAVGSTHVDSASGMKYTVGANQTLTLTEGSKTAKTVTIDTVTINGKAYKVTTVGTNAFKGAKLTKVTFGDNVITIEKNAFSNCKSLKTVIFGKNVKTVKANAFSKCTKVNTVTFQHTGKLPTIKNAFKGANKKPKKIQVKKALIKTSKKKNAVLKQLKAAGFKKITAKNIKGKK